MKSHVIITVSREYGSGGHDIAVLLAQKLGWKLYDKDLLAMEAQESGYSPEQVEEAEITHSSMLGLAIGNITGDKAYNMPLNDRLFNIQSSLIRTIADQQNAVIVGRCADAVLADYAPTIDIFIQGSRENRISRVMERENMTHTEAEKQITHIDKSRATYYNYYTDSKWGQRENYDMIINSDIGIEDTADILYHYVTSLLPRLGAV